MITLHIVEAKGIKEKVIGLLRTNSAHNLLINTRFGIHTFGMKFPIDIVIIDRKNKVVKLKEHLLPNKIFFWFPFFSRVLELPSGTIKKRKIKLGEYLHLVKLEKIPHE